MKIIFVRFSQINDCPIGIPKKMFDDITALFSARKREFELFFIEIDGAIEGFFTLPQKQNIVYLPLYHEREFQPGVAESLMKEVRKLLESREYKYLSILYRSVSPVKTQLPLLGEFLEIENSSSSYHMDSPVQPAEIEPDRFSWNMITPDEATLLSFQLTVFPNDPEYMGLSWDALVHDYLTKYDNIKCINCNDGFKLAGCLMSIDYGEYIYIYSIGVHPDYRRNGIGRKLLTRLMNEYPGRLIRLEAYSRDVPAITLYRNYGFKHIMMTQLIAKRG